MIEIDLETFMTDGYLILREVIPPDQIESVMPLTRSMK